MQLTVLLLLLILDAVTQTVLIASLVASAFIAFAVPRSLHSDPRHPVRGYVIGLLAGALMSALYAPFNLQGSWHHAVMILSGARVILLAMFMMVVSRAEHPPAAALALGSVPNEWNLLTLIVVLVSVIGLSIIKPVVTPTLIDIS